MRCSSKVARWGRSYPSYSKTVYSGICGFKLAPRLVERLGNWTNASWHEVDHRRTHVDGEVLSLSLSMVLRSSTGKSTNDSPWPTLVTSHLAPLVF
jgi:hypothetical protein